MEEAEPSKALGGDIGDDSYLIKERKPTVSFYLFKRLLREGRKGLLVSRRHPSKFKDDKDLEGVRVIWLSHTPGKDFHNPRSLSGLNKLVCDFIAESEPAAILLDGLEYLILNNDFVHTLLFVEHVHEFAVQHRATILLPIAPEALEPKELALLERNLEVLEGEDLQREIERRELVDLLDTY